MPATVIPLAAAKPAILPPAPRAAIPLQPRPRLSDALFGRFAALVYELSGMRFEANKNYFLSGKIDHRVRALGLPTFEAYLAYLGSPAGRTEYGFLLDEVTINETFFFRHGPQLQAFCDTLLRPLVFARRAQRRLTFRLWSCAASTGDELYTLALMLADLGLAGGDLRFELIGTDISHDALEKARAGVYRQYNIRNVPPALLQRYFVPNAQAPSGATWTLKPEIRNLCQFRECNLLDAARTGALGKFDVIFCRNVLIYFDEPSKEKAVQNLAGCLAEDGCVLLGHAENIYGQRHMLRPDKTHTAAIAYIKAPSGTPKYSV